MRRLAAGGRLRRRLAAAILAAVPAAAGAGEPPPRVVAIELRADAPIAAPTLRDLLTIEPGEPLDGERVRRSLRNLQASGAAGAVEAWTLPADGGVRLVFALTSRVRVEAVEIEGELGLRRAELAAALPQTAAAPLSENRVLRGVYRLQDLYRQTGYEAARVRVAVDVEGRAARVVYRVDAGPRTTVGSVRLVGLPAELSEAEMSRRLRLAAGAPLEQARIDGDRETLTSRLFAAGYRSARVSGPERSPGAAPASVDLLYRIEAGPRIELSVIGIDLDTLRRRGVLDAFYGQAFDEVLMLATVADIRRDLQERGHYRARVDWSSERRGDLLRVEILVQPGEVYELAEVSFRGNQSHSDATLASRVETTPRRALRGGRLVDEVLAEDLDNLRSFYALEGFWRATVGPAEITQQGTSLRLAIPIDEGPRRRVADLRIDGLGGTPVAPEPLPLVAGGPFHPALLTASLEELRARLEAAGYLSAQVDSRLQWSDDSTRVEVEVRVLPGPRALVDRVIVRGNQRTAGDLVRRTLELEPGMPLSRDALLEAQRRLYRLGVFSRAEVRMAPAPPFASRRDVMVRLSEGAAQRLSYGLGYDSEDGVRGLVGYSHANLLRRGVSMRLNLRWSERERQARLAVRQPYVGRWRLPVTYSIFAVDEAQESFDSRRRGFQLDAERIIGSSDYGLLYTFKIVEVEDADPALEPLEIDRRLQEIEISSLTPSYFRDRRDDPLLPTRGWTAGMQIEVAFPLAAETEFVKLFAQHSRYVPLGRLGVVAASARAGAIQPSGDFLDPTLPPDVASRRVPISERFFGGGRNSHRAYRRDRLGITGETVLEVAAEEQPSVQRRVPVGGNGLLLLNLDYRFPLAGPLGGTAFVDLGNVWGDWRDVDPRDLKAGAGVGLRYLSPIGPLRLEVGWKLDREVEESPAVVFLSFGNPF